MTDRIKKLVFMYWAILELNKNNSASLKNIKIIFEKVMAQWVPVNIVVITRQNLTLKSNYRSINFRLLREHQLIFILKE